MEWGKKGGWFNDVSTTIVHLEIHNTRKCGGPTTHFPIGGRDNLGTNSGCDMREMWRDLERILSTTVGLPGCGTKLMRKDVFDYVGSTIETRQQLLRASSESCRRSAV